MFQQTVMCTRHWRDSSTFNRFFQLCIRCLFFQGRMAITDPCSKPHRVFQSGNSAGGLKGAFAVLTVVKRPKLSLLGSREYDFWPGNSRMTARDPFRGMSAGHFYNGQNHNYGQDWEQCRFVHYWYRFNINAKKKRILKYDMFVQIKKYLIVSYVSRHVSCV